VTSFITPTIRVGSPWDDGAGLDVDVLTVFALQAVRRLPPGPISYGLLQHVIDTSAILRVDHLYKALDIHLGEFLWAVSRDLLDGPSPLDAIAGEVAVEDDLPRPLGHKTEALLTLAQGVLGTGAIGNLLAQVPVGLAQFVGALGHAVLQLVVRLAEGANHLVEAGGQHPDLVLGSHVHLPVELAAGANLPDRVYQLRQGLSHREGNDQQQQHGGQHERGAAEQDRLDD
jgi:hypothetical protein